MKIVYWSDYSCPYCYIGQARLKKAIRELGAEDDIEIELKAFQLDPYADIHSEGDTLTRFAEKYGLSLDQAGKQIEHISQLGRNEGIEFNYATTLFTNTMDAHRLTKLAQNKKDRTVAEKLTENLYAAYFTENLELADHEVLKKIGVESGLDREEVENLLDSDTFREDVIRDEAEASGYGIHAVPFFVIGNYAINGAQPASLMKEALIKALQEEKTILETSDEMTCGPNGCRLEY